MVSGLEGSLGPLRLNRAVRIPQLELRWKEVGVPAQTRSSFSVLTQAGIRTGKGKRRPPPRVAGAAAAGGCAGAAKVAPADAIAVACFPYPDSRTSF
jgi:hypothetical protein